ncbi:hypothetical protein L7F22_011671 [Adiantum nelumboides]|nr:hypothetical protein [Adiantum nelumboides]
MALEGRTELNSRSLHWAPLRSWNLFSGRVRSRLPDESPSNQLPRSQSVRNYTEGGRVGSATSRGSVRPRASESARKGGDISRRDHKQRVREGNYRQGRTSVVDEQVGLRPSDSTSRRRALLDRSLEALDDSRLDRAVRPSAHIPSAHIAHNQQHHHHEHHHHHYHYHHLYHQPPRRLNENQDRSLRTPADSGVTSSSCSNQRNAVGRLYLHNQRRRSIAANSNVASNSHNAVIEARERLDERLRGPALNSHSHAAHPAGFMDDFSVRFDDEEDAWGDDELGIQDWLAAWGYGEGWQSDLLLSAEQFSAIAGLSKSVIKNLPKEIFVPPVRRRERGIRDASTEQDDCSVCLEHFFAGQLLIHLPCKHRFHPDCLTPWLESHGQCPYCRAKVVSDATGKAQSGPAASASVSPSNDDLQA